MGAFHRAGRERVNVFPVGGDYCFRHYVSEEAFEALGRYYRRDQYRFEVPGGRFGEVAAVLEEHGYDPVVVDAIEPYAVVKRKYTNHPRVLFSASVLHRSAGRFNCFVLRDHEAVREAVEAGATPLAEADVDIEF